MAARLDRQAVLLAAELVAIVHASVLGRQIGDAAVMHAQLLALGAARASVHVIPEGGDDYAGYEGGFTVTTVDGRDVVYLDSAFRGFVLEDAGVVLAARERFERLLAEALPVRHSRDVIMEMAERWKQRQAS